MADDSTCQPFDLTIWRGCSFDAFEFEFRDENNEPEDYTGYTLEALARPKEDSSSSFDLQPEWVDASLGQARFAAKTPAATSVIARGEYGADIVLVRTSDGHRSLPYNVGMRISVLTPYTR